MKSKFANLLVLMCMLSFGAGAQVGVGSSAQMLYEKISSPEFIVRANATADVRRDPEGYFKILVYVNEELRGADVCGPDFRQYFAKLNTLLGELSRQQIYTYSEELKKTIGSVKTKGGEQCDEMLIFVEDMNNSLKGGMISSAVDVADRESTRLENNRLLKREAEVMAEIEKDRAQREIDALNRGRENIGRIKNILQNLDDKTVCVVYGESLRSKEDLVVIGEDQFYKPSSYLRVELRKRQLTVNSERAARNRFKIGDSRCHLYASWGMPTTINRSVGSWGVSEQWVYESEDVYVYIDNGRITSFQD